MWQFDSSGTARNVSAAVATLAVAVAGCLWPALAQETKQKVFKSPAEAMKALVEAAQGGDRKGLLDILGLEAEDILSSGDEVADRAAREGFLSAYRQRVDLVTDGGTVAVILGTDAWPFPIPIVKGGAGWVFDTAAGKEELINRRIGRNELATIKVCQAYVEAQQEYSRADREGNGIIQYAQKFFSDPGQRNGLYWEVKEGETPSPLGPLVAEAATAGYKKADKPIPYHGYYYRILMGQGTNAPGGAYSYLIHGHMVAGFALVAWPAEYGVSGVMTFIVNQNGIVYQRDLGPNTFATAQAMTLYDPDKTWSRAH